MPDLQQEKKLVLDYFNYIKPILKNDSIYRLLSPLLQIFFGVPESKKIKNEIHKSIQNKEIDKLENLFLKFISINKDLPFN